MKHIVIKGLSEHNLKHISLVIPKEKITVFTGVSGSGKSSIVFDTIAAESQRQMNMTYPPFVQSRLPKYKRPAVEYIDNLTSSVIVDQSALGGNARSTVGTISNIYSTLRLLFSRFGSPYVGTASIFSFNNPSGMCKTCAGLGKVLRINIDALIDYDKSWNEGCVKDSFYQPGSWSWKRYAQSGFFALDKPIKDYSEEEHNLLFYGSRTRNGEPENKKIPGLIRRYESLFLHRDLSTKSNHMKAKAKHILIEEECQVCNGQRLNKDVLMCKIEGYSIGDMSAMELTQLRDVLSKLMETKERLLVESILDNLDRMIKIGLPYLHLGRETSTLSGGEAQRLKFVRYMGSSLTGMTYIFDEPSTGMHPSDVYRLNEVLKQLCNQGNTVLVVEHDRDIISIADHIIDIGPGAGVSGGEVMFSGSYDALLEAQTPTSKALRTTLPIKTAYRQKKGDFPIRDATLHNLKHVNVDVPKGIMTVVTGVAGSGKSTLITKVFAKCYEKDIVLIDQGPITATNRSNPATYLGFFDDIRMLFALSNKQQRGLFSFNSSGACNVCKGKGVIVTELAFMDPIVMKCEECNGTRYSKEALACKYNDKNIVEVLALTVLEALLFFKQTKIVRHLRSMEQVGLSYLTLGQALSTLSGGERQRIKLAKHIGKKGTIFVMDEPTTGLHMSDIEKLLKLFDELVSEGNTLIIIEHNLEIVKQADWIIDIGPAGGNCGGEVVFEGTPDEMVKVARTVTAECLRTSLEN